MKVQSMPNWSADALQRKILPLPPGTLLTLEAGPGETAIAIKLDGAALGDPKRLNTLVAGALGVALDPMTTKRLSYISGTIKDLNNGYTLMHPGHGLPVGAALDGLAIVTSTANFVQALHGSKGKLEIAVAGIEVAANVADTFAKSTTTTLLALAARNIGKLLPVTPAALLPAGVPKPLPVPAPAPVVIEATSTDVGSLPLDSHAWASMVLPHPPAGGPGANARPHSSSKL